MKDEYDLNQLVRKPKKRINSRNKGNSFERKTAKILNEYFKTDEFSRTPGSGAFATTHKLPEHLKIYGDLITPEKFKYTIECKKGYNKENLYSLFNYSSDLWKFIQQSEEEAEKSKKDPLLLFQQDRQSILAITRKDIFPEEVEYVEFRNYRMYKFTDLLELDLNYWFSEVW